MHKTEEKYNFKEIFLSDIKYYDYKGYTLIKNFFLKDKFLIIPNFNLLFNRIISPFLYLLLGPFISLFLNKKSYEWLKKYNEHFKILEVNGNINETPLFLLGIIIWIYTPFYLLYSIIEIIGVGILFPTYPWSELKNSIDEFGYSPKNFDNGYLKVGKNNGSLTLLDGNHRYMVLLRKYGKEFKIETKIKNVKDKEKIKYVYDWDKLKKSIDKYGYKPKKFKRGYLKVKEHKNNSTYTLLDGNHRYRILSEKYGRNHMIDIKIRKRIFPPKWEIKKMALNNIMTTYIAN